MVLRPKTNRQPEYIRKNWIHGIVIKNFYNYRLLLRVVFYVMQFQDNYRAMRMHDDVARCLSGCPAVTRHYCVQTAKYIIKLFSPSGGHTILVFPYETL